MCSSPSIDRAPARPLLTAVSRLRATPTRTRATAPSSLRCWPRLLQALALVGPILMGGCTSSSTSTGPSPAKCQVSLEAVPTSFVAGGGTGTVSVSTQPECAWTASVQTSWMSEPSPTSGQGTGQVTFQIPANPLPVARRGEIDVNGSRVSVTQEAAPCAFTLTPTRESIGADGGSGTVAVAAAAGCAWTAGSNAPWITVTSGASGSGNGTVGFAVAANAGDARTGTLTIAGQTFTVAQGDDCGYTITPTGQSIGASGGAGAPVAVAAAGGCTWTTTSGEPWITVTSGATGSGNGTVGFSVAANPGAARTGTLTIAGRTFTVTQAAAPAACTYTIMPAGQSLAAGGGAGTPVAVAAAAGCTWTAASGVPWITVTS
ncbi:MAG: hypothetical protein GEU82_03985, partial [Luteitalea sp.]|nr:hypothetical protein [Luteitalea sp.]